MTFELVVPRALLIQMPGDPVFRHGRQYMKTGIAKKLNITPLSFNMPGIDLLDIYVIFIIMQC